jgi:thiol-disulfide isomerase/thioredoxin
LEDLTNAYAARKLQNLDLVFNSLEKGYISGMLASEACLEFIPNQKIINYLFFDKINRELAIGGAKHQKYLDFLFANTSKGVVDQFKEKYETLKASASSSNTANEDRKDAFNFELHDAQGKLYKLEDFKGKLLFIDFWASWCAPCKMQIPYIKEVEKIYEGKDIVFASVSLDKSEEAWLKSDKEENLHGYVLHAKNDFRNPFPMAYGISSIPRFMLIDADGKMISDNAPRPQSKKELMALIDADLYKKELKSIISKHFDALGVDNLKGDKGLVTKSKQSMMGLEIELLKQYSYPNKLRFDYSPVENPQFRMMIGEDFFKPKFFVTNNNSVYGNLKNIKSTAESWHQLLSGFEIFLTQQVVKEEFELADENTSNNENSYVVQFKDETSTTKYFIDKDTYLIKKIISTVLGSPRTGGGTYEAITKYEDYKNSDGVMVPFSINLNNYMTVKVSEAHLKPIDEVVFSNIEKSKI